jgi:hypothetical protein
MGRLGVASGVVAAGNCKHNSTPVRWHGWHEPLASLVLDRALDHFVHGLLHDDSVARGQRHVRVGQILHIPNELGIENESFAIESRELDHVRREFKVQGFRFQVAIGYPLSAISLFARSIKLKADG